MLGVARFTVREAGPKFVSLTTSDGQAWDFDGRCWADPDGPGRWTEPLQPMAKRGPLSSLHWLGVVVAEVHPLATIYQNLHLEADGLAVASEPFALVDLSKLANPAKLPVRGSMKSAAVLKIVDFPRAG